MCSSLCTVHTYFTLFFFFNDTATTEIYTLSLHDALPIPVHGDARADVAALERHARLHAEPERGAGARQRDDGPHFLDDPGEHLFDVGGSGVAPPDHPPPTPHDGRIRPSIAPASPALESRFV